MILDNHSAHISQENARVFVYASQRFSICVDTDSRVMAQYCATLFGEMARTFLKHIRLKSWEELRGPILLGIGEINAAPLVHRWRKFGAIDKAIF